MNNASISEKFTLKEKVVAITGGAGLLGEMHAEAVLEAGGNPVILDLHQQRIDDSVSRLSKKFGKDVLGIQCDITSVDSIKSSLDQILKKYDRLDSLVNNAATDPKV